MKKLDPALAQIHPPVPEHSHRKDLFDVLSALSTIATVILTIFVISIYAIQASIQRDQDQVARQQEILQLRAYVGVTAVDVQALNNPTVLPIVFHLKNFGSTPASKVEIQYASYFRDSGNFVAGNFNLTIPTSNALYQNYPSNTIVYPGDPTNLTLNIADFNEQQLAELYEGQAAVAWYGTVTYRDIFGNPDSTDFCFIFYDQSANIAALPRSGMCANHRDEN